LNLLGKDKVELCPYGSYSYLSKSLTIDEQWRKLMCGAVIYASCRIKMAKVKVMTA